MPNNSSVTDPAAKSESRRWTNAVKTILKRYGLHDRKGAETWLKDFEAQLKAARSTSNDRPTLNSIDFNQLSAFAERDYLRTSGLGDDLKDHLLRAKYFIALARTILHLPRQGAGYQRTLEEMLAN